MIPLPMRLAHCRELRLFLYSWFGVLTSLGLYKRILYVTYLGDTIGHQLSLLRLCSCGELAKASGVAISA